MRHLYGRNSHVDIDSSLSRSIQAVVVKYMYHLYKTIMFMMCISIQNGRQNSVRVLLKYVVHFDAKI